MQKQIFRTLSVVIIGLWAFASNAQFSSVEAKQICDSLEEKALARCDQDKEGLKVTLAPSCHQAPVIVLISGQRVYGIHGTEGKAFTPVFGVVANLFTGRDSREEKVAKLQLICDGAASATPPTDPNAPQTAEVETPLGNS